MTDRPPETVRKRAVASRRRTDRRIVRTEQALGAALVELMLAREFESISVQQVLERASVARATFYAHFRNKHDLLLSETERFCRLLEAHFLARAAAGRRVAPVAELFAHVAEYHGFQRALDRSGLREVVYGLVGGHLARIIEHRLATLSPEVDTAALPVAVTSRVLSAALIEMLRWWLDRGAARPTATEMDAHFHEIVWGGVRAVS
jgi:AcrR family transcriptional regulator